MLICIAGESAAGADDELDRAPSLRLALVVLEGDLVGPF